MLLPQIALAKDLGQYGQVFIIKEQDIIEYIKSKLSRLEASGELFQHQETITNKIKAQVRTPTSVIGIITTEKERTYYYDPTYEVTQDITDNVGRVIAKAGDKINPLDHISLDYSLIFIDGDDKKQVDFAIQKNTEHDRTKIILIKGSPLDLQEQHNIWIYFDQHGYLVNKLGITQVPAIVIQDKKQLKIQEVKIDD
jgi:conjugal transfer pilus assembly protein TraW